MEEKVTLSVYECSEFHTMGEIYENIQSVDEAISIWNSIPSSRINGIKSIAVVVGEGIDSTEYEAIVGKTMDLEMLHYYSDITKNQKAMSMITELKEKVDGIDVIGNIPDVKEEGVARIRHHR